MLISSMDQLHYYSVPKDGYLEIDARTGTYAMAPAPLVAPEDVAAAPYVNEENSPKNGTKSSLYKTELCKRFSEFGSCRYGAKCQFAHGVAELRHVVRHPKYKTTKCKSYWGSGHCPYGSRCRFIHDEAEALSQQPQYSPPQNPVFMHEKSSPAAYASMGGAVSANGMGNSGYLYGDVDQRVPGGMPPYQKEYAPLPTFEKSASVPWGMGAPSRSQARMTYGDPYGNGNVKEPAMMNGLGSMTAPASSEALDATAADANYPDLQDAIDALVKFSISPSSKPQPQAQSKPRPSSLDSISTTPLEALSTTSTTTTSAHTSSSEFSLEADDMWKHFPTLSDSPVDFEENEWPTGVSLSLEATGLFDPEEPPKETTTSPKTKKDEASPRLSVFERFH